MTSPQNTTTIEELLKRTEKLKTALEFYANPSNWNGEGQCQRGGVEAPFWSEHDDYLIVPELDFGQTAQEALKEFQQ